MSDIELRIRSQLTSLQEARCQYNVDYAQTILNIISDSKTSLQQAHDRMVELYQVTASFYAQIKTLICDLPRGGDEIIRNDCLATKKHIEMAINRNYGWINDLSRQLGSIGHSNIRSI